MTLYNPDGTEMSLANRIKIMRARRDKYLSLYVDNINAIRWNSMTVEQQQQWVDYRNALLNIPQQPGFPDNIDWPVKPE